MTLHVEHPVPMAAAAPDAAQTGRAAAQDAKTRGAGRENGRARCRRERAGANAANRANTANGANTAEAAGYDRD